jgi:hypothetical protein
VRAALSLRGEDSPGIIATLRRPYLGRRAHAVENRGQTDGHLVA